MEDTNVGLIFIVLIAILLLFFLSFQFTIAPTNEWRIYRDENGLFFMKRRYTCFWIFSYWKPLKKYVVPYHHMMVIRHFKTVEECELWARAEYNNKFALVKEFTI